MIGAAIKRVYRMADAETLGEFLRNFLRHDTHPFLQFVKYGVAGLVATVVSVGVFAGVTISWLPVTEDANWLNYTYANALAFFFSCIAAYLLNVWFVFEPGRHSRGKEMFYFFGVAGIAFAVGTPLGQWMVNQFDLYGALRYVALSVTIVTSVMVDYACRKFFIFKG